MRKITTGLIVSFGFLMVELTAVAEQKLPPSLVGPTTVSPGCTQTYTIYPGTTGSKGHCVKDISAAYLNDTMLGSVQVFGERIQITFDNKSTDSKSALLTVNYHYWNKCNQQSGDLKAGTLKLSITVRGMPEMPSIPVVKANGSSYTVTTSASNAMDYLWHVDGGTKSGLSCTISIVPDDCGSIITGTVQAFNTCDVRSDVRSFSMQSPTTPPGKPTISGPVFISDGGDATFSATGDHLPTSWEWQVNYTPGIVNYTPSISSFIVLKHQNLDGQTYLSDIRVRVNNRCGSSPWSDAKEFAVVGSNESAPLVRTNPALEGKQAGRANEQDLFVFPNSETSEIYLSWDLQKLMQDGYEKIDIYDLNGRSVKKVRLKKMKDNVISIEEIDNGQYIFKIVGSRSSYSQKILVKD